jgi:2-polyprenyl-3-methyl-5-hydroxy-6-metoxy-1,4-benzoquinol methylase
VITQSIYKTGAFIMKLSEYEYWDSVYTDLKLPRCFNDKDWKGYQIKRMVKNHLNGGKFLEAGCAPGKFGAYFSKYGYEIYGFDYSDKGIAQTKKNWELLGVNGKVKKVDLLSLDDEFEGSNFDLVWSYGLIEHFEDPELVVKILSSLVKPNGILITIIPNTCNNSLKMMLTYRFNYNKFKHIKSTHKEIQLQQLRSYHRNNLEVLSTKRVIGVNLSSIRKNKDSKIKTKFILYLNRIQSIFRSVLYKLQYDYLASNFVCVARKR